MFRAYYENAAKVEAVAKARGFTGNDGESWHDFVEAEADRFATSRDFNTLAEAIEWVTLEARAGRTVYGCGTVLQREVMTRRCSACDCRGVQDVHQWTVSDTGIDDDRDLHSHCVEDE